MKYKCQDELLKTAGEFIRLLSQYEITAAIVEDSFRDYTVKVSVSIGDETFGNVNLYYSPKKDIYSLRTHELLDKSIIPKLEECWQKMFPKADDDSICQIYVDGSFLDGLIGYGVVILNDGQVIEELSGSVHEKFSHGARNVAGEIVAVEKAIDWCRENSVQEVSIFYDCKGLEKWALGEWKTNVPLTQRYAAFVRNCGINVHWHKVDSHTGDRWNDRADELAKAGVASASPESAKQEDSNTELTDQAEGFVEFLQNHGYKVDLIGIYGNPRFAKLGIFEAEVDVGYVNIYCTKKVPFLLRYHELKDRSYKDELERLWQEYHYGERQLPL